VPRLGTGASQDYKRRAKCPGMPVESSEGGEVPEAQAAKLA